MTDQELNESLLKKIGFKPQVNGTWRAPDKSGYFGPLTVPDLVHDLSACFKWLVPELRKQGMIFVQIGYNSRGDLSCYLFRKAGEKNEYADADTESKALCLAADKFLKE